MVDSIGPRTFVPGRVEEHAIVYANSITQTVENAVLMVALPAFADYLGNSRGGILWPQRQQLFWKLGNLAWIVCGHLADTLYYFPHPRAAA